MKIQFLGGAGCVTGSKYLIETGQRRILVDCGLYQGQKELRLRNWQAFPVKPSEIDALILTHAHIDHTGYIPLFVKNGFKGTIYSTPATLDLCKILLPDSGRLQEEEAEYANRRGYSKHRPALPLYTQEDAENCLSAFVTKDYGQEFEVTDQAKVTFSNSGHILGSALVRIKVGQRSIVFTGDLGRKNDPILKPAERIAQADYLVVESTYGDRLHDPASVEEQLAEILNAAWSNDGVVLVPAFSVGRSQLLLYHISRLKQRKAVPDIPVFLNSPMSINVTGVFCDYQGEHRLSVDECERLCDVAKYVRTVEESKHLNSSKGPMVIISANGMATGGRILHHLAAFAPDPRNTILFTGYQATGTRGRSMIQGANTLKIHGQSVPLRARVEVLHNLSAHADSSETIEWMRGFQRPPGTTFITHGEPLSSQALQKKITSELGWNCQTPKYLEVVELS